MIKRLVLLCIVCMLCASCAKVKHLPRLLVLKGMQEEQVGVDSYVEFRDQKFAQMVDLYKENKLKDYSNKDLIQEEFGEPLHIAQLVREEKDVERWIYRKPVEFFKTDKLYLFFDDNGQLVDSNFEEYVEPEIQSEVEEEEEDF